MEKAHLKRIQHQQREDIILLEGCCCLLLLFIQQKGVRNLLDKPTDRKKSMNRGASLYNNCVIKRETIFEG